MSQAGGPALLAGKTAVITGATRGIGFGIAEVFAAAGASLVLTGRDTSAGQRAVAAMEAIGTKAWFCPADMRNQAEVQAAAAAAERFGGIDILVQNAGMYPEQPIEHMTSDDWDLVHHTNLRGTFFAVQACIPAMRARGGGRIVLVSSITGVRTGFPGLAHFAAMEECIPLRRLGQPAEIGATALFLASDLASYITGQSIVVDGGQTLPEIKQ